MFHGIFADNLFDSVAIAPQSLTMQSLAEAPTSESHEAYHSLTAVLNLVSKFIMPRGNSETHREV